jgi:hypothetical protein
MWLRWLPWRYILSHAARTHGFIDPVGLLAQFERFSRPAQVLAPTELLRAGILLQARGFINSQAIQHNLDWMWPYWVQQQFDPLNPSFIPRAFSMSHINITHRNWTAVGLPGYSELPIVDPRGMVTPHYDGWSIDFWIVGIDSPSLVPSKLPSVHQSLTSQSNLRVVTHAVGYGAIITCSTEMVVCEEQPCCHIEVDAACAGNSFFAIAIRPFNPEGVSFIHDFAAQHDRSAIIVNKHESVFFSPAPERIVFSRYKEGDVFHRIKDVVSVPADKISCDVGMATAAAVFPLHAGTTRHVRIAVPLAKSRLKNHLFSTTNSAGQLWDDALGNVCATVLPDSHIAQLFTTAIRTMILHAPADVYAGPYIYKRFWFRDAVLIAHAMLVTGLTEKVVQIVSRFFPRQTPQGYFQSQEGEWDSNGQVLWLIDRLRTVSGTPLNPEWYGRIKRAATWIQHKRRATGAEGLMPAGFSAEHLGPNDCYYWDDFWSIAGLRAASRLLNDSGDTQAGHRFAQEADELKESVNRSLRRVEEWLGKSFMPASPYRRMDSAAVGSLAATYPLQVFEAHDPRVGNTTEFLLENCFINGALFHDISHSGLNPYLTLHIAQAFLRAGDNRYWTLMSRIADLASPTGQWPEAIHPQLGSGCMGDGQHVWAAAEWVMMVRNCFVREEDAENKLVLCSGVPPQWLDKGSRLSLGPTHTAFGSITVWVTADTDTIEVGWNAAWQRRPAIIEVALPFRENLTVAADQNSIRIDRRARKE